MKKFYVKHDDETLEVRLYSLAEYEADSGIYSDAGNGGEDVSANKEEFLAACTCWLQGEPVSLYDAVMYHGLSFPCSVRDAAWNDSSTNYYLLREWPQEAPLEARCVNT